jgi:hypothetical protein
MNDFNTPSYLKALKTIDYLVFSDGVDKEMRAFEAISKKFRFESFGIIGDSWDYFKGFPNTIKLSNDFIRIFELTELMVNSTKLPHKTIEHVMISSALICPTIVFDEKRFASFKPISAHTYFGEPAVIYDYIHALRALKKLSVDIYIPALEAAINYIDDKNDLSESVRTRRTAVKERAKNFLWKLGQGLNGSPVVYFCDLLCYFADKKDISTDIISIAPVVFINPSKM